MVLEGQDFNFLPTHGFSIKPLKVFNFQLLAREQKATELQPWLLWVTVVISFYAQCPLKYVSLLFAERNLVFIFPLLVLKGNYRYWIIFQFFPGG